MERDQTTGQRRLQGENSVMEVSAASGPESSILEASSVTDVDDESDKSGDISITSLLKDSSLDTTTSSGDSLQNVNDFVKQFELGSGLSSSKLLDSSVNSEDQHNSSVDSVQDVNEFVKQFQIDGGLSCSILLDSTDESVMEISDSEISSKENFLKSTETVSKLLDDLTRKDKKEDNMEKDPQSMPEIVPFRKEQLSPKKI